MKKILLALGIILSAAPVLAHDYWLLPEKFQVEPGQPVNVRLYLGEDLKPEEERPYEKNRTPYFQLIGPQEPQDLTPALTDNQKPLTTLTPTEPGSYLLVLDRNASTITLPAKKFNAYLKYEGLTDILQQRTQAKQSKKTGRERYSRSIKSVLQVGDTVTDTPLQTLNRPIEIIPQQNPITLKPGNSLGLQVLFEGQPIPQRRVTFIHQTGKKSLRQTAITDAEGKVSFKIPVAGVWMVQLVHMRACTENCKDIDWESFWSTLTFNVKK